MCSIVVLLALTIPAAPPPARPIPLRLERAQEFVYHTVYNQESDRPGSNFSRLLDTYVLILETTPQGALAAIMTVMRVENKAGAETVPVVRLEYARIDPLGRVTLDSTSPLPHLPIDGPPLLDPLPFIELPAARPEAGQQWESVDADQAPLWQRLLVTEFHRFDRCWKIKGEQSSGDWNLAGRTVWKRNDMAWMSLQQGFIVRRERTTDWRTESGETWKSSLVAELELMPPASVQQDQFNDRKIEIKAAIGFARELTELMKPRGEPDYRGYDQLLRSLDRYTSRETPYAVAMKSLRRRAELARRGERPPEPLVIRTGKPPIRPVEEGEMLPDFIARELTGGEALKSEHLKGRPAVLIFVKPSSQLARDVLHYAPAAAKSYAGRVNVHLLLVEGSLVKPETPIFDGKPVLPLFAGRSTPRFIILDKSGRVRTIHTGWNGEFRDLIHKELLRLVDGE